MCMSISTNFLIAIRGFYTGRESAYTVMKNRIGRLSALLGV
jgi:hypothetical protein